MGMKKECIVELREEEADELMDEHWVGELVRCKDCRFGMWTKNFLGEDRIACIKEESFVQEDRALPPEWFCADGEKR